jgi:ribosome-associated protein
MLVVNNRIQIPLRELHFTFARSSGPGGQNVNKVNTKATMRWSIAESSSLPEAVRQRLQKKYRRRITTDGDLVITSQRFRDRGRNVADCLSKLRDMVASVATAPKRRKPTAPTQGSKVRRRKQKEIVSRRKQLRRKPASDD